MVRRSTEAAALAARVAVAVGASLAALARLEPELVGQNQVEIPHFERPERCPLSVSPLAGLVDHVGICQVILGNVARRIRINRVVHCLRR